MLLELHLQRLLVAYLQDSHGAALEGYDIRPFDSNTSRVSDQKYIQVAVSPGFPWSMPATFAVRTAAGGTDAERAAGADLHAGAVDTIDTVFRPFDFTPSEATTKTNMTAAATAGGRDVRARVSAWMRVAGEDQSGDLEADEQRPAMRAYNLRVNFTAHLLAG